MVTWSSSHPRNAATQARSAQSVGDPRQCAGRCAGTAMRELARKAAHAVREREGLLAKREGGEGREAPQPQSACGTRVTIPTSLRRGTAFIKGCSRKF
eukprot:264400-Prymnesium_polylepis.1